MNKYDYIYNKLKERVDDKLFPGFSILISKDGKEIYKRSLNYSDNQIFRLASMTKPITAVAVLKAEELGLININDEITKYLDGFNNMVIGKLGGSKIIPLKKASNIITVKDLLRHQSGIGSGVLGDYQFLYETKSKSLEEMVQRYKNWYLDFEPRSMSSYSGLVAFEIAAYIIEKTSGLEYYQFLKKYIFNPLGMIDTTYQLSDEQKERLVPMYSLVDDNGTIKMEHIQFDSYTGFDALIEGYQSGAAGLMSTIDDYSKFANMLAGKGIYNGVRIIKEESVNRMIQDLIELPCPGVDEYTNWGYGVYVRGEKAEYQPLRKGTFGWSGAYSSHFFVNCNDNISVIMMTNIANDGGSGSPSVKILESAYAHIINQD